MTFATLLGAQKLWSVLGTLRRGRVLVVTAAPVYRCPAAPYEAALFIDAALRRRGVRGQVELAVHSAEPAPMGVAGMNVSAAVTALLAGRGIDYRPVHQIAAAGPGRASFTDGQSVPFELLVHMPPIRLPAVAAASPLASSPTGWIRADRETFATAFPGVYAIGDNTQVPLSIGKPLPRAVFAHAQALVVDDNIAAAVQGQPGTKGFDGHGGCFIETGYGKAAYGSGDFYAEPGPAVGIRPPSRLRHLGKVLFEYNTLRRWL